MMVFNKLYTSACYSLALIPMRIYLNFEKMQSKVKIKHEEKII